MLALVVNHFQDGLSFLLLIYFQQESENYFMIFLKLTKLFTKRRGKNSHTRNQLLENVQI